MNMILSACLLQLCLVFLAHGQQFYNFANLDNLGDRINAQLESHLRPLEGLGERISQQVQSNIGPAQVNLQNRLGELDGLGDRISTQVNNDLEPVRAIDLNFKIKDGVGGTTIATHYPSGKRFIIQNGIIFTCSGEIDINNGHCSGSVSPFKITKSSPPSDWCFYRRSYSQVNDQICISTGTVSVSSYNGQVTCRGQDDNPTLFISVNDYKKMCSSVSESTEYRYIPNESDPSHITIPNENKYVPCENSQKDLCIFNEKNPIVESRGGSTHIHIGNRNGGYFSNVVYYWVLILSVIVSLIGSYA